MRIVLDSNVLVDAFLPEGKVEERKIQRARKARRLWKACVSGMHEAWIPAIGLAEICASLSRLKSSKSSVLAAVEQVQRHTTVVYEDEQFAKVTLPRIADVDFHGADAVFAVLAALMGLRLVTCDATLRDHLEKCYDTLAVEVRLLDDLDDGEIGYPSEEPEAS